MTPIAPHLRRDWTDEFGRKVFMARRRAGLSQESLSKAAGLHRTYVGLVENGKRTPRLDSICLLARGLGIKPSELIDGIGDEADRGEIDEAAMAVGRRVRQVREAAGLGLEEVARRSKRLSASEIEAIEQGIEPDPPVVHIFILAAALGVTPADLFGGSSSREVER